MFNTKLQKLIIVCDDKTKDYANYLMQLISLKDDTEDQLVGIKDGSVEAAIWTEKQYIDNQHSISSNAPILFIGDSKTAKSQRMNIVEKYNKFGMTFGWLGNRAVMYVKDAIRDRDTYVNFIEYYKEKSNNDKLTTLVKQRESKAVNAGLPFVLFIGEMLLFELSDSIIDKTSKLNFAKTNKAKKTIMSQQYSCLTLMMYLEGLQKFLEE